MREKGVEKREMKNRDRFTGRIFRRMWGPAIISSAGWALSDIADAVVVGQRMGAVGLAAIALILPVYMINCMFAHGTIRPIITTESPKSLLSLLS